MYEATRIRQPTSARPQLLFFYSNTDGASRRAEGFIAQVLQRRKNHDTFVLHHVDVEARADLAQRFRIAQVPTLLVVDERKIEGRLERPTGCRQIEEMLRPWLH